MTYNSYQLHEVCDFIDYRGKTPPKTISGVPLITAKIIKNGIIQPPQEYIAEDYYYEWMSRGIPRAGSVVFTTEAPLGEVAQIRTSSKVAFAQRIIVLEPNKAILDPDYLLYALQEAKLKSRIEARATGTTVMGIKSAELKKVVIDLPPLEEQKKIASVLKSMDERVFNNTEINHNLAEMLQAIYQQWFGNCTSATKQGYLSDICAYSKDRIAVSSLHQDSYYSTENMLPGKVGAVDATNLPTIPQTTACHPGDTLISNIRPYFKKMVYCDTECGCSTDVLCFTPILPSYSAYVFCTLYADKFFDYMVAGSRGTKMPRGDKQQIMAYPITCPTDDELAAFDSVAAPILMRIITNRKENKHLSSIRDTMLPKLMSGKLDVSEVQL